MKHENESEDESVSSSQEKVDENDDRKIKGEIEITDRQSFESVRIRFHLVLQLLYFFIMCLLSQISHRFVDCIAFSSSSAQVFLSSARSLVGVPTSVRRSRRSMVRNIDLH
jgi:hypothetical protein